MFIVFFQGTNGGVTVVGLFSSFVGGLIIGLAYFLGVILAAHPSDMAAAPRQSLVILVGGLGGRVATKIFEEFGRMLCKKFNVGRVPASIVHYTRHGSSIKRPTPN